MCINPSLRKCSIVVAVAFSSVLNINPSLGAQPPESKIEITRPARCGAGGPEAMDMIAGKVMRSPVDAYAVIYAWAGGIYWVQPLTISYATPIKNGEWSTRTHLGQRYAALLVKAGIWKAPATLTSLPKVGGDILAMTEVACG